jgi:hypothetical protein
LEQIKDLPSEVDFIRFALAGRVEQQATEEPGQCRVTLNGLFLRLGSVGILTLPSEYLARYPIQVHWRSGPSRLSRRC